MAKIRNDPNQYRTRTRSLPSFENAGSSCPRKMADRERSYLESPISEGFYIDHRRPPRD